MKLAQALILRADCQRRLADLAKRLNSNARVLEDAKPDEEPEELLRAYEGAARDLEVLIRVINATNVLTVLEPGVTMSDALARRDVLAMRHKMLAKLLEEARPERRSRYDRDEWKTRPALDMAATRKQLNDVGRDYRQVDLQIQALNWQAELQCDPDGPLGEALQRLEGRVSAVPSRQHGVPKAQEHTDFDWAV